MKTYIAQIKLFGMLIIAPLIVWQLTLRNTTSRYRDCLRMQQELELLQRDTTHATHVSNRKSDYLPVISNGDILEQIRKVREENRVSVVRYTPWLTGKEKEFEVYTGELVLAGNYIPLLRVMHDIESDSRSGRIVSGNFRSHTDPRTRKRTLRLTLLLQQIEKHDQ